MMELKFLNLRFLIYLAKIPIFLCILVLPTVQNNKQIFCKTWHSPNLNFTQITKFNLETRIFQLCPNVAGVLKNVYKRQIRAHLKKKLQDEHFDVAWTRKMRWLALHPSFYQRKIQIRTTCILLIRVSGERESGSLERN